MSISGHRLPYAHRWQQAEPHQKWKIFSLVAIGAIGVWRQMPFCQCWPNLCKGTQALWDAVVRVSSSKALVKTMTTPARSTLGEEKLTVRVAGVCRSTRVFTVTVANLNCVSEGMAQNRGGSIPLWVLPSAYLPRGLYPSNTPPPT